jgi:hypothetical protein
MARGVYTISFKQVSVAAVQDLLAAYAGSSKVLEIHSVIIGQITGTTVQNLPITMNHLPATVTTGSGGTAPTPQKTNPGDAAATFTARANDTTQATTSGTSSRVVADVFNTINGYFYQPPREDRPRISSNEAFVVSLDAAPGSALTMSGTMVVEELN